jgi:hypothetical protein
MKTGENASKVNYVCYAKEKALFVCTYILILLIRHKQIKKIETYWVTNRG